ncbi:hypothetical protein [Williamsia sp.]|uniref:hypothetical protein n=1 Tax=Williamsia sp. TaxID=1872085 RepID=UPI002F95D692
MARVACDGRGLAVNVGEGESTLSVDHCGDIGMAGCGALEEMAHRTVLPVSGRAE